MPDRRSILCWVDDLEIPLAVLIRVFLGGYFLYAGVVKALNPIDFLLAIHTYGVLPEEPAFLLNATATILPWLEILCGLALVLGIWIRGATLNIAVMLVVFTPAILMRGLEIQAAKGISFFDVEFDCGCGTGVEITWIKLGTNVGLFLLAALALISRCRRFTLDLLLDRVRSAAKYCRRCGQPLAGARGVICERCRDAAAQMPAGTPDAAS